VFVYITGFRIFFLFPSGLWDDGTACQKALSVLLFLGEKAFKKSGMTGLGAGWCLEDISFVIFFLFWNGGKGVEVSMPTL